jgi:hypothetical protein
MRYISLIQVFTFLWTAGSRVAYLGKTSYNRVCAFVLCLYGGFSTAAHV